MGCIATSINNNECVSDIAFKWQWYSGTSGWKDYDAVLSAKIDKAYIANIALYPFTIQSNRQTNSVKYEIAFATMKQRNLYSNKLRDVRRMLITNERFTWKYYDEKQDKLYEYNDNISLQLETAYHSNTSVTEVTMHGIKFQMRLNELPMHQYNLNTDEISQILRIVINNDCIIKDNNSMDKSQQIKNAIELSKLQHKNECLMKENECLIKKASIVDRLDGPSKQFYNLLSENNLEIYFDKFREEKCCDIGDIEYLIDDEAFLENNIEIKSAFDRKKFIGQCKKVKDKMDTFKDCDLITDMIHEELKKYGIVTMDILCNEIKSKLDIKKKLDMIDDEYCDLLWNVIELQWKPQINEELQLENKVNNDLKQNVFINEAIGHVNVEDTASGV